MKMRTVIRFFAILLLMVFAVSLFAFPTFASAAKNGNDSIFTEREDDSKLTRTFRRVALYTSVIGAGIVLTFLIVFCGGRARNDTDEVKLTERAIREEKRKRARAKARALKKNN